MITDADRAADNYDPTMGAFIVPDRPVSELVAEAYALGRIQGAKEMQDAAIIAICRFFTPKP